jgi:Ni2+-binding GTPase involved in maturation of urease and hydrogenase
MTIITVIEKDQIKYNNHSYFPNHYRMIIAGDSGSGKTVLLSKLLLTNMLDWDILYLFTPSILQSSYQVLIEGINAGLLPAHIYGTKQY